MIDARIDVLEQKIDAAREREGVLTAQIETVSEKIDALQDDVDAASTRLDQLEVVLALHERKLDRLNQLYALQTRKLVFLQRQHKAAIARLSKRVVEIYTSEPTSTLGVVLEASNFSDMLDQLEFLNEISRQDQKVAARSRTPRCRCRRRGTRPGRRASRLPRRRGSVAARTAEQRAVRDRLAWSQRELATARRDKQATLAGVQEDKETPSTTWPRSRPRAPRSRPGSAPPRAAAVVPAPTGSASAAGFVWPVHGIFTSGFGWRWGRMHEGIDLAVPNGTPVVAAAAGTVIVAGWMGGYGNLVVVDHGNGIATAYGHNT